MENKILLQDMADLLARHDGISRKNAETFVRTFFELIQEGLEADQLVKIKGFGTFKLVEVSERESVNINTGERFQIGGHTKVSFTPDNSLKEAVNKPFAHFQTVVLNEETNLEELESVEEPEPIEVNITVEKQEQHVAEVTAPAPQVEQTISDGIPHPPEQQVATADEEDASIDIPSADNEVSDTEEKSIMVTSQPAVQDVPTNSDTEPEETHEEPEIPDNSPLSPADTTPINTVTDTAPDTTTPEQAASESIVNEQQEPFANDQDSENTDEVKYIVSEGTLRGYRRWKIIALSLFILILMLLSYFAGYFKMFCPCEWIAPDKQAVTRQITKPAVISQRPVDQKKASPMTANPQPTPQKAESTPDKVVTPQPTETKPAASTPTKKQTPPRKKKELAQVPGGKYVITGTRLSYRVDRGETLRSIAEHIYGSKGYVNYIIVHNHIISPDNVAAGTIIQLPELELKE